MGPNGLSTEHHIDNGFQGEDFTDTAESRPDIVVSTSDQAPLRTRMSQEERQLRLKVDLRLCTIAGLLCSLNLIDSGILSSASVTSMLSDLSLTGDRYSVSIFIFTVSNIVFQLPATILVRVAGPRLFFSLSVFMFGLLTLCTAFVHNWREMIALRVLLGISMSGIYPGLTYLISTWYTRREQQLRFAVLQAVEVWTVATGSILNFGLYHLDGRGNLKGWQWMFLIQGAITICIGLLTYFWMVDFPEHSHTSLWFLSPVEASLAVSRINKDRGDAGDPEPFSVGRIAIHFRDPKLYGFCALFFLLNLVSTALSYFLPIILQGGMNFTSGQAILLSAPPYYYAAIPALLSSFIGDHFGIRGPIIVFNAICLIAGFCMLGFPKQVTVRYIGTYLATGAYVSNWAALNAYQANNIVGQWKRATVAAAVTACNGLGGIAGSYIVREKEAPRYLTAVWVSIGSHILIILIVACCSMGFWVANKRQRKGKGRIEGVDGFKYTY